MCCVVLYCVAWFGVVVSCVELYCMIAICLALCSASNWIGLEMTVLIWIVLSCSAADRAVWCCRVLYSSELCCIVVL